jgi:hypothetical protein
MGYHTDFQGELKFKNELTETQLTYLQTVLGEDCREHPEWDCGDLIHIDLELLDDFSGLKWNGGEKTVDMEQIVSFVIRFMKEKFPDFGLTGKLLAQGENLDDRWELYIENGKIDTIYLEIEGEIIECPHCEMAFVYNPKASNHAK